MPRSGVLLHLAPSALILPCGSPASQTLIQLACRIGSREPLSKGWEAFQTVAVRLYMLGVVLRSDLTASFINKVRKITPSHFSWRCLSSESSCETICFKMYAAIKPQHSYSTGELMHSGLIWTFFGSESSLPP